MKALDRKLVRDLWQIPGQVLAISLVMACGVAVLVMSLGTLRFLKNTRDSYYDRHRFAHVFGALKRAPRRLEGRLKGIPGVAGVDLRIVNEVVIDVPGLEEPAIGRLISVPKQREVPLNDIYLKRGRYVDPIHSGEVLVSQAFALANSLDVGDSIDAVINGRMQALSIVGIALSPEYIFQIRPGDILPDDRRFGILWINEADLEAAFDMEGAFNSVAISLMRGASEQQVIDQVDRILEPYGSTGAFGRDRQVSAKFLSEEIKQLRAMAVVMPSIFFSVACFLLNVVLSRMISKQREQIAALKAFGYSNIEVGVHYLKFLIVIASIGCCLGTVGGEFLGRGISRLYAEFYRFPVFSYQVDWVLNGVAVLLTTIAAAIATIRPVWRAVVLPPAEAMRPMPPATFHPTIIERLGIERLFSVSLRMTLRELERRPLKSFMSSVGISGAVAVMVLGNFGVDAFGYLIQFQFFASQQYEVSVTFVEETSPGAVDELLRYPGVMHAESFRSVPVRFRARHREHLSGILGLDEDRRLLRILNVDEQPVPLPKRGVLLGDKLAELLDVEIGDRLLVEVLNREDVTWEVPVTGIFTEYAGTNAYMHRDNLHRLIKEGPTASGAYLNVDANHMTRLYRQLKQTPRVAGVAVKTATIESFINTIQENQLRMQSFNLMFACIIAFGVVYNTAQISLAERSREFATLRVIGFTQPEVANVLLGELTLLTLLAIPIGFFIGYGFCWGMVQGFESELFRIPLIISLKTLGFATSVTLIASLVSGLTVRRKVNELDLISVLKNQD